MSYSSENEPYANKTMNIVFAGRIRLNRQSGVKYFKFLNRKSVIRPTGREIEGCIIRHIFKHAS